MPQVQEARFSDLVAGETRKAFTGSTWYLMLGIGIVLAGMTVVGSATETPAALESGVPIESATAATIRFWFMTLLASGLFGVIFVSREYTSHSMARSVLLAESRVRLFWAKILVTTLVGVLYAAVTVALLLATLPLIGTLGEESAVWSAEATRTVIGIAVVVTVAAPWGAVLGWLLRSSVVAVGVFLALTLIVDEGLFRLAPAVGRFTMQIAMGAVYQDGKAEALTPQWGAVVVLAWLVLGIVAALQVFRRRDVL